MISQYVLFLSASVYLCNAKPLLSPPNTLIPRDTIADCQNVTSGFNATCWDLVPSEIGMESWLSQWNTTTTTCQPGEMWANCFMRLAGLPSNATKPIRCDLIGPDVCPNPSNDFFANDVSAEVGYGVASIWALQQYMTTLYQFVAEDDEGIALVKNGFLNQTVPRSVKPILIDILNDVGDPIATNLTKLVTSPTAIGQATFVIPTEYLSPEITGQTVGYLLQHAMEDWASGAFKALSVAGNLISVLGDSN